MRKKSSTIGAVKAKSFGLLDLHIKVISTLTQELGYLSESETVRNAIMFFYEKKLPDYIYSRSAKDIEKRKEIAVKQELESLSDEDFVKKHFPGAPILPGNDGKLFFLPHWWSNTVQPKPLNEVREVVEKFPDLAKAHSEFLKERGPVLEYIVRQNLQDEFLASYGIVV